MELLAGWNERLEQVDSPSKPPLYEIPLKISTDYYANEIRIIDNEKAAQDLLNFARQRPLSSIGINIEYLYQKPDLFIKGGTSVNDIKSIYPLYMSLALAEPKQDSITIYPIVIDLRKQDVYAVLRALLRLSITFVGHDLKTVQFSLWVLGLGDISTLWVWDTYIAEKSLCLGKNHWRYKVLKNTGTAEEVWVKNEVKDLEEFSLSLTSTCQRYGVHSYIQLDQEKLQSSILNQKEGQPLTQQQISYLAEKAVAVARLYPLQIQKMTQEGLLNHLVTIEMSWVRTNARIEWNGVRVDTNKAEIIHETVSRLKKQVEPLLGAQQVPNINSPEQLENFFKNKGLLQHFKKNRKGSYSFDKDHLKNNTEIDSVIDLMLVQRKLLEIESNPILSQHIISEDGRVHPQHHQLGTHTGRQTSTLPNILGLGRLLRPLVIPESGYGIGEVDLSQIEVGVAAAVYGDQNLIDMFNTGDVYSAMAKKCFADELPTEALQLDDIEFKQQYHDFRSQMKSCTLGMIYGITPKGLAANLNRSEIETEKLLNQFMGMFPQLIQAQHEIRDLGGLQGFVSTSTGLRRYRGKTGASSNWERNWYTNHPVQGTSAALFKLAGNRLDSLYKQYDGRIIIPLHDAFIFEAPLEHLEAVAEQTGQVMCQSITEMFHFLLPKVEINISEPSCWNKDGETDLFEQWVGSVESLITNFTLAVPEAD